MRKGLEQLVNGIDRFNGWVGETVSWLNLFMVLITFTIVLLRYGFQLNWIWLQESVTYMHALVFMAGAAYTFRDEAHVRVDIFYRRFSDRGRALVNIIGGLFLLLPMVIFLAWVSFDYVMMSWSLFEGSREAGGLPFLYVMKSYILILAGMLFLQGIASIGRSILSLRGGAA